MEFIFYDSILYLNENLVQGNILSGRKYSYSDLLIFGRKPFANCLQSMIHGYYDVFCKLGRYLFHYSCKIGFKCSFDVI